MSELCVSELSVTAGGRTLVDRASFSLKTGELVILLGPNGAGKTSLLRGALGLLKPSEGHARLNGMDVRTLQPVQRARHIAYLPQARPLAWPNRVRDVVALGRFPHSPSRLQPADDEAVHAALLACHLVPFADRRADTLSGGELARMHCARAFAAQTPLILADEPVAFLDPRHQFAVMELFSRRVREGAGALIVLHDVGLAARYADRLIWMRQGRILADGPPGETLDAARLAQVYELRATVEGRRVDIDGPA